MNTFCDKILITLKLECLTKGGTVTLQLLELTRRPGKQKNPEFVIVNDGLYFTAITRAIQENGVFEPTQVSPSVRENYV
jgi:hypothetical protein